MHSRSDDGLTREVVDVARYIIHCWERFFNNGRREKVVDSRFQEFILAMKRVLDK